MLQELYSKLMATRRMELMAKFWDWHILLRANGTKGRVSCYWDQEPDAVGYNSPHRLWEVAESIEVLNEQMTARGYPLSTVPLDVWYEDPRPDVEVHRLAKVLSQHNR